MPSPILQIEGLAKRYGGLAAVDGISLGAAPGEIFALLGPNGAGKTTLIGCATGLIQNFGGSVRVAGRDVRSEYRVTRQMVGLVPQELTFDGFMRSRQALRYQGGFFGRRDARERAERLLRDFGLETKAEANTRALSGGMKRRLMICKALMHEPALLFLDEPTAGVDIELRENLWHYVRQLRERGMTVFLTTHYLEEAEQLADRIGVINRGRLLTVASKGALRERYGREWLRLEMARPPDPALVAELERSFRPQREGERGLLLILPPGQARPDPLVAAGNAVQRHGNRVIRVEAGASSLETIFRRILDEDRAPETLAP